jgi:hypothetical protein
LAFYGTIEDGAQHVGSAKVPHGVRIVPMEAVRLFTTEELFIWEMLYQTIVDCHKIATNKWRHFRCMWWHGANPENELVLATARAYTSDWIKSERFWCYVKLAGFDPDIAQSQLHGMLTGVYDKTKIECLIKQIGRERDTRRNRGGDKNGER